MSLLSTLLDIGEVEVNCVYDINSEAPAMMLAAEKGISVSSDQEFLSLADNPDIDLILEVTGRDDVFEHLREIKHTDCKLIGSKGNRIIFSLLDAQQKAQKQLEVYKDGLEDKIADRTKEVEFINTQLRKSVGEQKRLNEQLQRINTEKTKYLLHSTHHLKAPFAAIQSYMDLIVDGYTGKVTEMTMNIAGKVQARCDYLSHSIKQMLKVANLKSYLSENLKIESCNINELLSSMLDGTYTELGRAAGVTVKLKCDESVPEIRANCDQLVMLFSALLDNAICYSKRNTTVEICVSTVDEKVVVKIIDQGIGIRTDALDKIFNEYYRTNEAVKQHPDGTGLGLTIAKEIATIHKGTIELESMENKGTVVTVTI